MLAFRALVITVVLIFALSGCKSAHDKIRSVVSNSNTSSSSGKPDDKGLIHSGTGTEKEKPAAGKTNVQGRVLFNQKPAANIEVKLCEKFNQYFGGCGGQTYTTAMTVPVDDQMRPKEAGAINGGIMKRSSDTPSPVITVQVDSIDDTLKKVEAAGGSTVQPRTEIPNMGAFGYFQDCEGNTMGLWESFG